MIKKGYLISTGLLIGFIILSLTNPFNNEPNFKEKKVRILALNAWQGAKIPDHISKTAKIIVETKADIVSFSEVIESYFPTLITELKKLDSTKYYAKWVTGDVGIISKFPIESSAVIWNKYSEHRGTIVANKVIINKKPIIIACSHLGYKEYALNLIRGYNGGGGNYSGWGELKRKADETLNHIIDSKILNTYNLTSLRDEAIQTFIDFSKKNKNIPIIFSGDFNEGSHLDWTERAKNKFGHNGAIVKWTNSLALQRAGFVDAYRNVFPNELTHPGFTWPSPASGKGSTSWTPLSDERDRIDFVYSSKNIQIKNAFIVGSKTYYVKNKPLHDTTIKDSFIASHLDWASDHKGVMIEFSI